MTDSIFREIGVLHLGYQRLSNLCNRIAHSIYYPFNVHGICSHVFYSIYNISNCIFFFNMITDINQIQLFKGQTLITLVLSIGFLFSISLIFIWILIISFFLLFFHSFKIIDFRSSSWIYVFDVTYFPLSTTFTETHKLYFYFHLVKNIYKFLLRLLWSVCYLEVYCLISVY